MCEKELPYGERMRGTGIVAWPRVAAVQGKGGMYGALPSNHEESGRRRIAPCITRGGIN